MRVPIKQFSLFLLLAISLQAWAQLSGLFEQQQEFLPVEQAYQLELEWADDELILVWQIAQDYYLYQHAFEHSYLDKTGQSQTLAVELPQGVERHDEYFGDIIAYYHQVVLRLPKPEQPSVLKAVSQGCADAGLCYPPYTLYFEVDPVEKTIKPINKPDFGAQTSANSTEAKVSSSGQPHLSTGLLAMLLSAFIGGLILNLMPCVFPVLAIKALQLTQRQDKAAMRAHGLMYLAGVLLSFLAVAAVMIVLRSAGSAIGWGFQLQNPWLVAALVYLFVVLALAMAGLIELGQRFMGVGDKLTQGKSSSSAFFTGVLAVVVASPCTAPFMGAALGFAVSQPLAIALLVFAFLALGMAAPLTLLSFFPQWSKWLPKPGLWMERVRQFFAFPLLLTAVWLLWVLGNQTSTLAMGLILVGATSIAFAFWCFRGGRFAQLLGVIALVWAASLLFSSHLVAQNKQQSGQFVSYSEQKLQALRSEGKAVFIDLTADWCITCLANEKTTLHTEEIQNAFKQADIVYMVGDWTNYDEEITALIERYQRSGIPLYLLYPPGPDKEAIILPQLLNKRIVLRAIEAAL